MSTDVSTEQTNIMKTYLLPALAVIVPLVVAFGGAIITGTGTTAVVDNALKVSGGASQQLEDLSGLLPLGFAFGAGLVASVNPCGFAMLPAYLALYMGSTAEAEQQSNVFARLGKALLIGAVVTLGFIVLFGIAGLIIGGGARQVIDVIPWIGLTIGIVLTFVGGWLLGGGKIYTSIAQQASTKFGDPSKVGVKGYFLFGLSYGTASLSCTLPIFIAVLGIGVATNTLVDSLVSFVLFALGMGTVILVLTIAMALFKGALVGALRKILPYTQPVSAAFMILAGAYIVFYWLTEGELLDKIM
ncbi:MAG: cytochrome c biogenesis protein CcdA [Dehalococcoidia bacterium]|nr:cytochrome c biogenesis protein CcdA [Dehalococcoidia bacterium]